MLDSTQIRRQETIARLRRRLRAWERHWQRSATDVTPTGCDALDELLPDRGIRPGSLVEWIAGGKASGAGTLALLAGRRFYTAKRPAILVDVHRQVYPLALAALGFDLSSLIMVRPHSQREAIWTCEESLRCGAVAMVWARIEHLTPIAFRRLRLAAEQSGSVGFLVRSSTALQQPSWADVRLLVTPQPGQSQSPRFRVTVAHSHKSTMRAVADIEIDAFRGTLHEVFAERQAHRLSVVS